jgi:hypothetical protein
MHITARGVKDGLFIFRLGKSHLVLKTNNERPTTVLKGIISMSRRTWFIFPLALVMFAVFAGLALTIGSSVARLVLPQRAAEDVIAFNVLESYTITDNVVGDVFVTGENITLDADSHIEGDASFIGDNVTIAGLVGGDLTVIAGNSITLETSAEIHGDVLLFGDTIMLQDARVNGSLSANGNQVDVSEAFAPNGTLEICERTFADGRAAVCDLDFMSPQVSPVVGLLFGLTFAGAAGLAVIVFPRQIGRLEDALRRAPRRLTLVGFGALLVVAAVTALWLMLLAGLPPIGILLMPVYGIGLAVFGVFTLLGWITLSLLVGDFLLRRVLRFPLPPLLEVMTGTLILLALGFGISLIPFGNIAVLPIVIVLTSAGVGAAFSTRLGRRPLYGARLVQG